MKIIRSKGDVLSNFSLSIFCKSGSILLYVYFMYIIIGSYNSCLFLEDSKINFNNFTRNFVIFI